LTSWAGRPEDKSPEDQSPEDQSPEDQSSSKHAWDHRDSQPGTDQEDW
jgi:hypothetical protein